MKKTTILLALLITIDAAVASSQTPPVNDGNHHGDPPYLLEEGWKPLLNGKNLDGWKYRNPERAGWGTTSGVFWGGPDNPQMLKAKPGPGDRIINTVTDFKPVPSDIVTEEKFGDIELYLEFMVSDKSNSGAYLQGLYEVQIWDSYGRENSTMSETCGSIYDYARPKDRSNKGGVVPKVRAERPTGQWQSFHIWFQAPRFDAEGKKIANAKFLRVLHNGILIHENIEREAPTLAAMDIPEAPTNPLMLQGDHGPIAYRNIYFRPLRPLEKK